MDTETVPQPRDAVITATTHREWLIVTYKCGRRGDYYSVARLAVEWRTAPASTPAAAAEAGIRLVDRYEHALALAGRPPEFERFIAAVVEDAVAWHETWVPESHGQRRGGAR